MVPVGCGNCIECRKQKSRAWQIRLWEDIKVNKNCYFITLTFSEEELTKLEKEIGKNKANAIATIAVRRFNERYRKKYKKAIRHWLITELGHTKTERLHIHGIIWTNNIEDTLKYWKYGKTDIGEYCNERTINYIIKYVTKIDNDHKGYQPLILCSPGIGKSYIDKMKKRHIYKENNTKDNYTSKSGHHIQLPIYYRNYFFSEEEKELLWLEKLDQKRIYIMGNKYSTATLKDLEIIDKVRKIAQERNIALGYGSDKKEWLKKEYNTRLKDLNL